MNKLLPLCLLLSLVACGGSELPAVATPQTADGHEALTALPIKGPHRGLMLTDGPFAIELAVYETNVPPEYRAWPTLVGKPLPLRDVTLTVEVTRLGDRARGAAV